MQYTIHFELKSNGRWVSKKFSLGKRSAFLGQVLKEMRAQPEIRNITYRTK